MTREPGGGLALAALTEVLVATGDTDLLDHVYEILSSITDRCAIMGYGVGYFGSLARYAGLAADALGLTDAAISHLADASNQERARAAPSWFAYAEIDLCRVLRRSGLDPQSHAERLTRVRDHLCSFNLPRAIRKLDEAERGL